MALSRKEELEIISKIADRALEHYKEHRLLARIKKADWFMAIDECHTNGFPLKLQEFLEADDANFSHDAFGIATHWDKDLKTMTQYFPPRFSKPTIEIDNDINKSVAQMFSPDVLAS